MATIKIHAGDFAKGDATVEMNTSILLMSEAWEPGAPFMGRKHTIKKDEIEEIIIATEENVKRIGATVGWGTVGAVAFGPLGLLAGLVFGGKGKDVTFIMKLKDGRKMLATANNKTYIKISALCF